ncbi:hypothetical protein PV783_34325 [Chitinophaga sp. CC14]|uniref:hypothetical protein n=1 Tax=Chitinophaga sp. CC14 TaxID=3029199 RepID=UPI003B7FE5B0
MIKWINWIDIEQAPPEIGTEIIAGIAETGYRTVALVMQEAYVDCKTGEVFNPTVWLPFPDLPAKPRPKYVTIK